MRLTLLLLLGFAVAGCATSPDLKVVSQTPAGVEYAAWCGRAACVSRQEVADMAQEHCRRGGQNAQIADAELVQRDIARGERSVYRFNCVR